MDNAAEVWETTRSTEKGGGHEEEERRKVNQWSTKAKKRQDEESAITLVSNWQCPKHVSKDQMSS